LSTTGWFVHFHLWRSLRESAPSLEIIISESVLAGVPVERVLT
jgi:hypothetical protein